MSDTSLPTCPRDGFPMLRIHGRLECVVEYLDRCLGGQRIVDIVEQDRQLSYVFENGHTLPLICPCCGESLTMEEKTRKDMLGRRLEAMAWETSDEPDGRVYPILYLEFTPKGFFSKRRGVAVAPAVAARLHHPGDCPQRPPANSERTRKRLAEFERQFGLSSVEIESRLNARELDETPALTDWRMELGALRLLDI